MSNSFSKSKVQHRVFVSVIEDRPHAGGSCLLGDNRSGDGKWIEPGSDLLGSTKLFFPIAENRQAQSLVFTIRLLAQAALLPLPDMLPPEFLPAHSGTPYVRVPYIPP